MKYRRKDKLLRTSMTKAEKKQIRELERTLKLFRQEVKDSEKDFTNWKALADKEKNWWEIRIAEYQGQVQRLFNERLTMLSELQSLRSRLDSIEKTIPTFMEMR